MKTVWPPNSHINSKNKYEVENSYITNKTLIPYFDVSLSSREFHQKKLVLSSSESWCNNQLSHQEGGRRRDSTDNFLDPTSRTVLFSVDRPTGWIKEALHMCKEGHRAMNRDEGSYQLSHAYDRLLDATTDRRIETQKNWVPTSSDKDLVMKSKRQNNVLKFWLWYMIFLLRIVIATKWIYFSITRTSVYSTYPIPRWASTRQPSPDEICSDRPSVECWQIIFLHIVPFFCVPSAALRSTNLLTLQQTCTL